MTPGSRTPTNTQREEALTDEQRAVLLRRQLKRLRVVDVVYDMMISSCTLGYQKLGLTDETRELRDLDDARVAIEALRGSSRSPPTPARPRWRASLDARRDAAQLRAGGQRRGASACRARFSASSRG